MEKVSWLWEQVDFMMFTGLYLKQLFKSVRGQWSKAHVPGILKPGPDEQLCSSNLDSEVLALHVILLGL